MRVVLNKERARRSYLPIVSEGLSRQGPTVSVICIAWRQHCGSLSCAGNLGVMVRRQSTDVSGVWWGFLQEACQTILKRLEPFKKKKPNGPWEAWVSPSWSKLLFEKEKYISYSRTFVPTQHM